MNVVGKLTLRSVWERRRRMVGTLAAVFLGVSFLAGTLSLSDTLGSAIDSAFTTAYSHTDVVVQNASQSAAGPRQARGQIDGSVLGTVRGVSGVAAAEPVLQGTGVIVGPSGKAVTGSGPRVASTWIPDLVLNPWHLLSGAAPSGTNQVVIDQASATSAGLKPGDAATIDMPQPVRVTICGIAGFGGQASGGDGSFAAFSLAGAQKYIAGGAERLTSVVVRADPGVSQQELAGRIGAVLPHGDEAITGETLIEQTESQVDSGFFAYFQIFLSVFAGIALLVAGLSIHNTFSISAAQRSRDAALLRAIGATRRQVTTGLLLEAALIGAAGSVLGLGGGIAITAGLKGAFSGLGIALPAQGLVFTPAAIAASVLVGIAVTLVAAITPAVRAGRVSPVEALRETDTDRSGDSAARTVVGLVLTIGGIVLALAAAPSGDIPLTGAGAVVAVAGTLALGPKIAALAARSISGPAQHLRGTAGMLAQRNAARNPKRTSGAATALMVGIAVVTVFTVFAASLKAGIRQTVDGSFTGQIVVTGKSGFTGTGFSPQAATTALAVPGVSAAVGIGGGNVLINGVSSSVQVADPAQLGSVFNLGVIAGAMSNAQLAASSTTATADGWRVGQRIPVSFDNGTTQTVTLGAIYTAGAPLGDYVLASSIWAVQTPQVFDRNVYIALAAGADQSAALASLASAEAKYAGATVETRSQYLNNAASTVNTLLDIVYLMLALAILIALLGIANTLSLAVFERTREFGLIRAVGATGPQIRSIVRWEAVITTMVGAVTGLVLGGFLGWALVTAGAAAGDFGTFTLPVARMLAILVICAAAGMLAGVRPARRAARLDLLDAITTA
ncbi:MAG TPA: FtsX-like permease family protein [Actinocrinis sp.]